MIEYINPQSHAIQLSSPEKKIIKIPARAKVILSEWYLNYCPKYLRVVRVIERAGNIAPKDINKNTVKYTPLEGRTGKLKPNERRRPKLKKEMSELRDLVHTEEKRQTVRAQTPVSVERNKRKKAGQVVGRRSKDNLNHLFKSARENNGWSVSDNIGIGILSYNRLSSLKRCLSSIRRYTDLSRTTIFVSDESSDPRTKEWLKNQKGIVVLTDQKRLGIAGNSNRLLRCLSRFKYGILLNDDVEVLGSGWERFYAKASEDTKYQHFCYHQVGVYGAKNHGKISNVGGHKIGTITEKPHGAVMFYTNELFNKVGYFDEKFGIYGMEHVDWSTRAARAGIQPKGFHDVIGSDKFFKIHQEKSAVQGRTAELQKARSVYKQVEAPSRLYVAPTEASKVPSISVVIPVRDIQRQGALGVVVNSIRAQLFPNVEIIVSEQDAFPKVKTAKLKPYRYFFAKNKYKKQPFTKAMAFNLGIANASHEKIILQDADILCSAHYAQKVYNLLDKHEGLHIGSKVIYLGEQATKDVIEKQKIGKKHDCVRAVTYFEGGSLACTKKAYFGCGGFNEIFEGYGVEDCDFFERLRYHAKFHNERSEDFVHMYHGRTTGWQQHHRRNKKIGMQLKKQYNMSSYITSLVKKIKAAYPEVTKELGV
jgi:GT2 family glycosyltransferase